HGDRSSEVYWIERDKSKSIGELAGGNAQPQWLAARRRYAGGTFAGADQRIKQSEINCSGGKPRNPIRHAGNVPAPAREVCSAGKTGAQRRQSHPTEWPKGYFTRFVCVWTRTICLFSEISRER